MLVMVGEWGSSGVDWYDSCMCGTRPSMTGGVMQSRLNVSVSTSSHGLAVSGRILLTNRKLLTGVSINLNWLGIDSHSSRDSLIADLYFVSSPGSPQAWSKSGLVMLLSSSMKRLKDNYDAKCSRETGDTVVSWSECLSLPSSKRKSDRICHPRLGFIPGINLYSRQLSTFCITYGQMFDSYSKSGDLCVGERKVEADNHYLLEELVECLRSIIPTSINYDECQLSELNSTMKTLEKMRQRANFKEIKQFIFNLSSYLNGVHSEKSSHIEPFQKQLILHTLCFVMSIKCVEYVDSYLDIFKIYFGLNDVRSDVISIFKQRASVFIIPRRHGKTWIISAILSILLLTVDDIHVGYVAHQKHVVSVVFEDIRNSVVRLCPNADAWLDVRKENSTITIKKPGCRGSMLMCATCFNKNVSIYFS